MHGLGCESGQIHRPLFVNRMPKASVSSTRDLRTIVGRIIFPKRYQLEARALATAYLSAGRPRSSLLAWQSQVRPKACGRVSPQTAEAGL